MVPIVLAFFVGCMTLTIMSDIASMTIPNRLCAFLAAGFLAAALVAGLPPAEIGAHLATGLVMLALTFALFALGWMGGGDAKMIAATALWLGPSAALANYLLLASILGGVLTLLLLSMRAVRRPTTGVVFLDRLLDPASGIPYGVALGGAGIAAFVQSGWLG